MKGCEMLEENQSEENKGNQVDTVEVIVHDTIKVSTLIDSATYVYKDVQNVYHFKIDCINLVTGKGVKYIPMKALKKNFPNHHYCCTGCCDQKIIKELLGNDVDDSDNHVTITNVEISSYND